MKLHIPALLLATLLFASCTSGTEGIFASLEREEKVVSLGGLNQDTTVTSMAEIGGSVNKYFATGGRALFSRSNVASATKWDKQAVSGFSDIASVGASNNVIFAVAGGKLFHSPDGSTWSEDALGTDESASSLVPIIKEADGQTNDELVLVVKKDGSFKKVYRISAGALVASGVDITAPPGWGSTWDPFEITAAAASTSGNYYLLNGNLLWELSGGFAAPAVIGNATWGTGGGLLPSVGSLTGLLLYNGNLYVSTESSGEVGGSIYKGTLSTSWTFSALQSNVKDSNGYPISFGSLLRNTVNGSLWIGTGAGTTSSNHEGYGYAELVLSSDSFSLVPTTDLGNYNSSDLPTSSVGALFSGTGGYFLGTVAHGLWYWNSSTKKWSQQ